MTLTEAKTIAGEPNGRDPELLRMAYARLEATRTNGGVRNSDRAMWRLERRLDRLREALQGHVAGADCTNEHCEA